ncbi:MAG: hypothetical protein IPL41_05405 [Micropruina sp.]|nr:hypothetical protein [Micropruina sp.]
MIESCFALSPLQGHHGHFCDLGGAGPTSSSPQAANTTPNRRFPAAARATSVATPAAAAARARSLPEPAPPPPAGIEVAGSPFGGWSSLPLSLLASRLARAAPSRDPAW